MRDEKNRDGRIQRYIDATKRLQSGEYALDVPTTPPDEIGHLGEALRDLARALETRSKELLSLERITANINAGLLLDEILDIVYRDFRGIIPFDRIGFSLIDESGETVRARWARTEAPEMHLTRGYAAPLAGSSLESILQTGRPRILNDLEDYLQRKPSSESTRLIVAEGMRSSLTCPLIANGSPVGFMFFSSCEREAYAKVHAELFLRIAEQLSVIVDKGRLVSELAAQKTAVERQNEDLRRLNGLKNRFLGMAAHDLRSPIGSIQMFANLLLDPGYPLSDAHRNSILDEIVKRTHQMLKLINNLLDITTIEAGELKLEPQRIELRPFLEEAKRWHAVVAGAKDIEVTLRDVAEGSVRADPIRLRQVLDNLISNAVKYSPTGSTVSVGAERSTDGWRLSIRDQGPGIRDDERDRLFQEFARLSAKPTGGEKSTGLGLAISRRVVEAHGGSIGVESTPGRGATFFFTLPDEDTAG
jgi:signal transduction histidine kinase